MAWLGSALLVAALTAAALLNALLIAGKLIQTSDTAVSLLAADAVLHGNVLLRGWHMVADNFYFTDILPFAAFEAVLGPRPWLLALVPAVTYATVVFLVAMSCIGKHRRYLHNFEAAAGIAVLLSSPRWVGIWDPELFADMHLASVLGALAAMILSARHVEDDEAGKPGRATASVALVAVTLATVASDPFSLVFGFGPALAVMAADVLSRGARPGLVAALASMAAGVAIGGVLPLAVAAMGGFATANNIVPAFVSAPQLGRNIVCIIFGNLYSYGAYPFGLDARTWPAALAILFAAAFTLVVIAVVRVAKRLLANEQVALLDRMLCAGVLCVLTACALSGQFNREIGPLGMWTGGGAVRYLAPAVLFAASLAARQVPVLLAGLSAPRPRFVARGALFATAAAIMICGSGLSNTVAAQPSWLPDDPPYAAARWLEQHGLTLGVGDYWSSNIVTAMSGLRVRVRSVAPRNGRLVAVAWASDETGYPSRPQFVMWQEPNQARLTLATVRATYAKDICRLSEVAGYRIAILTRGGASDRSCVNQGGS
jgi:hypothetical protein